ncbi:sulfatase-like hydrolase/transferase [Pseudohaliea sp.]|uniref:sulfatase family protein n=1 Tax=Pseudohaliea sp. TaxID=2740289 RepID=UPI0032EF2C2B
MLLLSLPAAGQAAPNILFILADDLGSDALGAFGAADAHTPHIDRLAAEGTRFTRHYVDASCAATRVGLLTGASPARSGFRPAGLGISPETHTYADALRALGYRTWHVGKWHAGFASRLAWPRQQGFDRFYGFLNQFLLRRPGDAAAWQLRRPTYRDPWLQRDNAAPQQHPGFLTDHIVDEAIARIGEAPGDRPWLLNVWTLAPHTPHEAPPSIAERYPDTPRGRYLAMVEVLDRAVGRLLAALDDAGVADNTLVLLAGDNGTDARFLPPLPSLTGSKGSFHEGGVRTPLVVRWPGRVPAGKRDQRVVAYTDYLATFVGAGGGVAPGFDFLYPGSAREEPLFWEAGAGRYREWSALTPDGAWRLLGSATEAPRLVALDGSDSKAPAIDALVAAYEHFRRDAAVVDYRFLPRGDAGGGILTGDALGRAPGYGGRTAVLCLAPGDTGPRQVLLDQAPLWSLQLEGGRLTARVGELEASGPLPAGRSLAVLVDSRFDHAPAFPSLSRAQLRLFAGGQLLDASTVDEPALPLDVYHRPAYLGSDREGGATFLGRLGRPLLFNDDLASLAGGEPEERLLTTLAARACASPAFAGEESE